VDLCHSAAPVIPKTYPLYKQCDPRVRLFEDIVRKRVIFRIFRSFPPQWGNHLMGGGAKICAEVSFSLCHITCLLFFSFKLIKHFLSMLLLLASRYFAVNFAGLRDERRGDGSCWMEHRDRRRCGNSWYTWHLLFLLW
jgi:hypothetical protein